LIDEQHGFRPGKSTCTNGVSFLSYIIENIESGSQIDVIITDFKKAFDAVNHELLIYELECLGLRWFKSYITGRKQFVRVAGVSSHHSSKGALKSSAVLSFYKFSVPTP